MESPSDLHHVNECQRILAAQLHQPIFTWRQGFNINGGCHGLAILQVITLDQTASYTILALQDHTRLIRAEVNPDTYVRACYDHGVMLPQVGYRSPSCLFQKVRG